jgi:TPR repeat protein
VEIMRRTTLSVRAALVIVAATLAASCARSKAAPDRSCRGYDRCNADCESGNMGACTRAATALFTGDGTAVDAKRGLALLERACKADEATACWGLSDRALRGQGVPRDKAKAVALLDRTVTSFEQECRGGAGQSCATATYLRRHGRPVVRDEKLAAELEKRTFLLLEASCRNKDADACARLTDVVDRLPNGGLNTHESVARLDVACDNGAGMACWRRGSQCQYGLAFDPDTSRATPYYDRAVDLLDQRCKTDDVDACFDLGARLDGDAAHLSHPTDPAVAYAKACDLGSGFACEYAAGWYRQAWKTRAPDQARADAISKKRFDQLIAACDRAPGQECYDVASWVEKGRGAGPADPARAATLRKRGLDALEADCTNEDWSACNFLAFDYEEGPAADRARTAQMFVRACQLSGDEQACRQAALRKP